MSKPKDRNGRELRVGDRVRCVDASGNIPQYIREGGKYEVTSIRSGNQVGVDGSSCWRADRFELIYATLDDIPVTPGMVEWSGTMYGAAKQVEARFPFPEMSAGGRNTTCNARTVAAFESAESAIRAGMAAISNRDECAELEAELRGLVDPERIEAANRYVHISLRNPCNGDPDEEVHVFRPTKAAALRAAIAAFRALQGSHD